MTAPAWLTTLVTTLATADDPRATDAALTVIRANGCTPDPAALDDAVTAVRDAARFRAHLGDWSTTGVRPGPWVDVWEAAADECDANLAGALEVLGRRAVRVA